MTGLKDIDELVLTCRNPRAKALIAEAVACYKAGAYRQCVVATWIAMMYDIIGKLEELEAAGSSAATQLLDPLRKAATPEAERIEYQRFEREALVKISSHELELVSAQEYTDLKRIFDDRHRCAHPAMAAGFEPYAISAEQARTHLCNAITCLLQHPPAQGTFALQYIWKAIESPLFPDDSVNAAIALKHGPLAHPRPVLVKNVVTGLLVSLLAEDREDDARDRQFAALAAVRELHRLKAEEVLTNEVNRRVTALNDERLPFAIELIARVHSTWRLLDPAQRKRLSTYFSNNLNRLSPAVLAWVLPIGELRALVEEKAAELPMVTQGKLLRIFPLPRLLEVAVDEFATSRSYAGAHKRAKELLVPAAPWLNTDQIQRILMAYCGNDQIYWSNGTARILCKVLEKAGSEAKASVQMGVWKQVAKHIDEILDGMSDSADCDLRRIAIEAIPQS